MTGLAMRPRSGRRVALAARYPARDPAMPQFISNHGLRMVEASLRSAALDGLEREVWDISGGMPERLAESIIAFDPDVAGFSTYLWSFPFFVEVARLLIAAGSPIEWTPPPASPGPERTLDGLRELRREASLASPSSAS